MNTTDSGVDPYGVFAPIRTTRDEYDNKGNTYDLMTQNDDCIEESMGVFRLFQSSEDEGHADYCCNDFDGFRVLEIPFDNDDMCDQSRINEESFGDELLSAFNVMKQL